MSVVQTPARSGPLFSAFAWPALKFGAHAEPTGLRLSERYTEAMLTAARLHARQTRKDGRTPYISHLQAVASLVLENGGTEEEAIAAWLHDAVEDQGGWKRLQAIRQQFGDGVADIVAGCSDRFTQPPASLHQRMRAWWQQHRSQHGVLRTLGAAGRRIREGAVTLVRDRRNPFAPKPAPWIERKMAYLEHLKTAPTSVLLVSSCDKLHNARSLVQAYRQHGEALWTQFSGSREGTLWYYESLIEAYGKRGYITPVTEELARTVDELHRLTGAGDTEPNLVRLDHTA